MKNIIENSIAGLFVIFIGGFLPWLATKRYEIYRKISPVLSRIAFDIAIVIVFFDFGIYAAYFALAEKYMTIQIKSGDIETLLIPLQIVIPLYLVFIIYLTVLDNIDKILRKTKQKRDNNP